MFILYSFIIIIIGGLGPMQKRKVHGERTQMQTNSLDLSGFEIVFRSCLVLFAILGVAHTLCFVMPFWKGFLALWELTNLPQQMIYVFVLRAFCRCCKTEKCNPSQGNPFFGMPTGLQIIVFWIVFFEAGSGRLLAKLVTDILIF
jgi:hypothetical protein